MSSYHHTGGGSLSRRLAITGLTLALVWGAAAARAGCLQVDNHALAERNTRYGITTAQWTADVENSCEEPYDATLTVQFLDAESQVLYRAVEIVMVQPGEALQAEKRVNLAEEKYGRIQDIQVAVEERRRPR